MLKTKEEILQDLVNEQFLCATKYWRDSDLDCKFNILACEQVFKHLCDKIQEVGLYEFKEYLKGFQASEYIKRFNDLAIATGFNSSVFLLTAYQEANINFLFNRYKERII